MPSAFARNVPVKRCRRRITNHSSTQSQGFEDVGALHDSTVDVDFAPTIDLFDDLGQRVDLRIVKIVTRARIVSLEFWAVPI